MGHATIAPAPSVQPRVNRSTMVLLTVAGAMLIGLIYTVVTRDGPVSCPTELIGAWKTSTPGYEQGLLVFTETGITFSVGADYVDAQAIRRLKATPDRSRTLYTVMYGSSPTDEQTLSFYYDTKDQTITFKNQSHLIWTRKAVQS